MSSLDLETLTPARRARPLPRSLRVLGPALAAAAFTVALLFATNVLDRGPSPTNIIRAYDTGFAAGADETRAALEADFEARLNAVTESELRASEERGRQAASLDYIEALGRAFNESFSGGFARGFRDAEIATPRASRLTGAESANEPATSGG